MRRFFCFCLLLSLPLVIMIIIYVAIDPFKVLWHYDTYYQKDDIVAINRGYASIMHYANHYKEYGYDSFVFGNSRSIAYYCDEWKKHIPASSVCYHLDVSGGSIGELLGEIKFITKNGTLKNALIIFDIDFLSATERDGILFAMSPILKEGKDEVRFQKDFLLSFYNFDFLKACIDYKISKIYKPYMGYYIIDKRLELEYDSDNNSLFWNKQEELIRDGLYYDDERIKSFENAQFPGKVSDKVINIERMNMLKEIKRIFDLQGANYRIVISPLYNQIKINPDDLQFLYDVFGKNKVFDFSGVNQWTNDYHYYYEVSHYRTTVANDIMRIIYSES